MPLCTSCKSICTWRCVNCGQETFLLIHLFICSRIMGCSSLCGRRRKEGRREKLPRSLTLSFPLHDLLGLGLQCQKALGGCRYIVSTGNLEKTSRSRREPVRRLRDWLIFHRLECLLDFRTHLHIWCQCPAAAVLFAVPCRICMSLV